jgi:cytochrome P450
MSSDPGRALFDPTHPDHLADPYPGYARLREAAPALWVDNLQAWVLSRYADVSALLRDPRCVPDSQHTHLFGPAGPGAFQTLRRMFERWMLFLDGREHARLRGLVNKAFTPRVVDRFRPHMERLTNDLLDRVQGQGRMDVIADLAFPLPVTVIAVLLGVPPSDHEQFRRWSNPIAATLEPVVPVEVIEAADQAAGELLEYFRHLVAKKRGQPEDDLLSALVHAEEQGQRLSTEELLANAVLLLAAGHETTVNLIGNGLLALLRHPAQMERLRREPGLIRTAVEELLRYDAPVQMTSRALTADVTAAGQKLSAGQEVFLLLGSGNRDAAQFQEPDTLDLGRADNQHLAFGAGPHYCVGAPLARAEAQVAFRLVLERFPGLQLLTEAPVWRPLAVLRGLRELPVRF